jgi:DNA transformation protein
MTAGEISGLDGSRRRGACHRAALCADPLAPPHHEGWQLGWDIMDREFLTDLFADFGPVTIRRMFSGFGISADGTNFALALRAGLYFRADEVTIPQYEAEGSKPFQYQTRAKTVTVNSYWQLPARLFDDTEELSQWARAALAAAQRAALKKGPKPRKAAKPASSKAAPKKAKAKAKAVKKAAKKSKPRKRSSS